MPLITLPIHAIMYIPTCIVMKNLLSLFSSRSTTRKSCSCRIKESHPTGWKKYIIKGRKSIFVHTMNYCFCSNTTIVHGMNKKKKIRRRKISSMKWIISMKSWLTVIFGTERVSQFFIEILHSIDDEKEKNVMRLSLIKSLYVGWIDKLLNYTCM